MEPRVKTKSPDTDDIEIILDTLNTSLDKGDSISHAFALLDEDDLSTAHKALTWVVEFLTDRKLYHKKQQTKRRILEKLIKEHLSKDEIAAISEQVEKTITSGGGQ